MTKKKQQPFWQRMALVVAAAFVMAFTIKSFARPGGIFSGGFNGISLLIIACFEKFAHISPPFALVNYTLNLIPLYISFRYLGKKLTAVAYERKRGSKTAIYIVEVHDEDRRHIADAIFTMFYTGQTLEDMRH